MSFSVELWDGYEFVYNTFLLHRRGLKDFIYMLSEKHDYEFEYAKGMKKIYDMNFAVTKMSSLQNGILGFKNDLLNQYNYTIEFVSNLREEIIDPLKNILADQNTQGKHFNTEWRKIEKEFKDSIYKLEKSRLNFHNFAKNAEDSKLQSELAKLSKNMATDTKLKLELKSQNNLKEAREAEKIYISNINIANSNREVYIETMKRMLNEFQSLEEKLIETIKDSLRKYVIYQVALIRNLQYDIEKKAGVMECINIQSDIREFIERNATNALPPYKFEYIPYISDIDSRANMEANKHPKEVLTGVKDFISNVFNTEPNESEPDSIETKNNNELEVIANISWHGKKLPEQEKQIFLKFIKEKKYRRYFLSSLNKFRISGLFTLEDKSYYIVGELLHFCLDEIVKDKDYQSAKTVMTLAQTLYKTATEPNRPRVFLQNLLETHYVWKSLDFWEDFIKYIINEEMHSQKNYIIYTFESAKDKNKRFRSIVMTQLISFSYNMLSFSVSKEKVKDVILYFTKYYDIEEDQITEIINNLEEYSNSFTNIENETPNTSIITSLNINTNPVNPDLEATEEQNNL